MSRTYRSHSVSFDRNEWLDSPFTRKHAQHRDKHRNYFRIFPEPWKHTNEVVCALAPQKGLCIKGAGWKLGYESAAADYKRHKLYDNRKARRKTNQILPFIEVEAFSEEV